MPKQTQSAPQSATNIQNNVRETPNKHNIHYYYCYYVALSPPSIRLLITLAAPMYKKHVLWHSPDGLEPTSVQQLAQDILSSWALISVSMDRRDALYLSFALSDDLKASHSQPPKSETISSSFSQCSGSLVPAGNIFKLKL